MAETETRLEILEDEVKVLKGEVKRTLVDLRSLLMLEDSPLGEGVATKRMAMHNAIPANETPGPAAGTLDLSPGPGPGAPPELMQFPQDFEPPGAPPADDAAVANQQELMAELEDEDDENPGEPDDEPVKAPGRKGRFNLSEEKDGHGEKESDSRGKSERVTSIYDEYRELLEETKRAHILEDQPVGPPLDVNLMANLVYWASLAKQRVGDAQLKDILQLYVQSGHSRPELQDLLLHICKMVDVESAVIEENGSDWVDLLFHLHGILTGGFPVMKIPYIRLPSQEEAQGDRN